MNSSLTQDEIEYLQEKQKGVKSSDGIIVKRSKEFKEHFKDMKKKTQRNEAIMNAYLDGYTQVDIASHLNLSKSLISKVVKSGDSLTGVN